MFNKIALLLIGIFFVWLGYIIMTKGGFAVYGYYSSFSDSKIIIGTVFIVFGVFVTCFILRKKTKNFEEKFLICPKCKIPFPEKNISHNKCPKCEVELEDLDDFHEKYLE